MKLFSDKNAGFSLKEQATYLFMAQVLGFAVNMIAPIILVRMMTEKEFGIYRQILFLGSVAVILMQVSIPQSLYYFFPRYRSAHTALITQTMTVLTLTSLVGSALFFLVTGPCGLLPPEIGRELLLPITLSFFLESVAGVIEIIFTLEARPRANLLTSFLTACFRIITTIGFFLVFRSVMGLVLGMIILQAGRFIGLMVYLRKQYRLGVGIADRQLFRHQVTYSLPMFGSAAIGVVGTQIDKGVITALMKPEEFAVYSVCSLGVLYAITLVCYAIGNVCLPKLSEMGGRKELAGVHSLWHKMILMNGLLLLPTVCFCTVYAEEIITVLYTKAYISGATIFRLNLLVLVMMMTEFGRVPQALGETRSVFIASLARTIVALGLALVLIPQLGLAGGAISAVAAYWVNGAIQLVTVKRTLAIPAGELLPWRKLGLISLASMVPAAALSTSPHFTVSPLATLLVAGSCYTVLVVGLFVWLKLVDVQECKQFLRGLR